MIIEAASRPPCCMRHNKCDPIRQFHENPAHGRRLAAAEPGKGTIMPATAAKTLAEQIM